MSKNNKKKIKKIVKPAAKTRLPKIKIKRSAKNITSRGGLVSVVKFIDYMGYENIFNNESTFERGSNAVYSLFDIVMLSVVGYISGASTLSGTAIIWKDKVLKKISGYVKTADETTIGRVFNKLKAKDIAEFENYNHSLRKRVWGKSKTLQDITKKLWVDADSTVTTVQGNQEGAAKGFNEKKKGAKSYHPLLAFCTYTKEILQGWFRTGSAYTSNGIVEFMKQLLAQLDDRKIVFRADSGFFNGKLFELLENLSHDFLVKVKLKNLNNLLASQEWKAIVDNEGWEQTEFKYKAGTWSKSRTFKAVRKKRVIELENALYETIVVYDYFCYATTLDLTPWQTHKCYGQRATSETWIEESKSQIKAARMNSFFANAAAFQSAILAYNTLKWMVLFAKDKFLKQMEPKTIRAYFIQVAAKLSYSGRVYTLNFNKEQIYDTQWNTWIKLGTPF
jgi:hypothetical protein